MDRIVIFDTTLRDGEQSPGATMTTEEKIQVAQQLLRLNVDIIEAGFPATSPGDLLAVREIARSTRGHDVAIAGLARARARWLVPLIRPVQHPKQRERGELRIYICDLVLLDDIGN